MNESALAQPAHPGELFVDLWHEMAAVSPSTRRARDVRDARLDATVLGCLKRDDGATARDGLAEVLSSSADRVSAVLAIMRGIDNVFGLVHPRALMLPSGADLAPTWVRECRDRRLSAGVYAERNAHRLIPRGPLLRGARDEHASAADSLSDRFAFLAIADLSLVHEGRSIAVEQTVISTSALAGVRPGKNNGCERILFIPVSEEAGEISLSVHETTEPYYVETEVSGLDPVARIHGAAVAAGGVDIALAPESTVSELDADRLSYFLAEHAIGARLIVAGSGNTVKLDHSGLPWNESRVLNGVGSELWRQRKLWPASMTGDLLRSYGVAATTNSKYFELNASGDSIVVADLDSLGRCVVLICQDMLAETVTSELVRQFQPDWVFSPILDHGVEIGRWAHRRCLELSGSCRARFACSTNAALAKMQGKSDFKIALAVGPFAEDESDPARMAAVKSCDPPTPQFALLTWRDRSSDWAVSTIDTTPSPA